MIFALWTLSKVEGTLKTLLHASIILGVLLIPTLLAVIYGTVYNRARLMSVVCITVIVKNFIDVEINIHYIVCSFPATMCVRQDVYLRFRDPGC